MATRTWKYAASTSAAMTYTIPDYGSITIPITASGAKPTGFVYVDSLRGDDVNGNGSMLYPYASIGKNTSDTCICASGTYREGTPVLGRIVIADGICILNGYGGLSINAVGGLIGFSIINYLYVSVTYLKRCMVINCITVTYNNYQSAQLYATRNIFIGCKEIMMSQGVALNACGNNVFLGNYNIKFNDGNYDFFALNNIFTNNNITITGATKISYSNFNTNNVKFSSSYTIQTVLPSISHKTTPLTGFTYIDGTLGHDQATMKALHNTAFGLIPTMTGCTDDAINFVDSAASIPNLLQDIAYTVKVGYDGKPIGVGAGMGFKVRADANTCDFDHSNSLNCTFADGVISFPSASQASIILTKVKDGLKLRLYRSPMFLGLQADRNGRIFDYSSDLATSTISPGTGVLETDTCYVVEVDSVTYNGTLYAIGAKFTTRTVVDFSATGAGIVRKVTSFPNSQTFRLRYSKTQSDVSAQPWLIMRYGEDAYYSTDDGTINGSNPKGNGDPLYDATKKQPLYVRWWQEEHTANINMLH